MSAKAFVDTNILMYAHDASTGEKHVRARALVETLWRERSGVVSTQVLQELCVNLQRRLARPLSPHVVGEIVSDYLAWDVYVNTGTAMLDALQVKERYQISFWDALIVQAADAAGAEILYSEDLSHRQLYGGVRVVNPFVLET